MLEVTTPAAEEKIGIDFANVYRNSEQYRFVKLLLVWNYEQGLCHTFCTLCIFITKWLYHSYNFHREVEASIIHFSTPATGSEPLKFASTYSQDNLSQFLTCLWKQNLVYWRSPQYNAMRLFFTTLSAMIFGSVFWNVGSKR